MKFYKNGFAIFLFLLLIVNLIWFLALQVNPNHNTAWNYLYNLSEGLIYLSSAVFAFFQLPKIGLKNNIGRAISFFGVANMASAVALSLWTYYGLFLKIEVPFPSFADVFFIAVYLFIGLAFWYLAKVFSFFVSMRLIIESVIIIVFASVFTFFISRPELQGSMTLAQKIFTLAYPIGDILLISIVFIVLRVSGGRLNSALAFLLIALALETVGDFVFNYRVSQNIYWNGDLSDLIYSLAAFYFGLGIVKLTQVFHETSTLET